MNLAGNLIKYPLLRILIFYVSGILIKHFLFPNIVNSNLLISISAFLTLIVLTSLFIHKYSLRWVNTTILYLLFFQLGFLNYNHHQIGSSPYYFGHTLTDSSILVCRVVESPEERAKSLKVLVEINRVYQNESYKTTNGKMLVYISKSQQAAQIEYGDEIVINKTPQRIRAPQNPHEFDYKKYSALHGVEYQCYLKDNNWKLSSRKKTNIIYRLTYQLKNKIQLKLQQQGFGKEEYGVVNAVLLGSKDFLDDDIREAFQGAGAMHILCVSGLHVGILYIIVSTVLVWIFKKRSQPIIQTIILLAIIWTYASISGFSPSISRAACMFSFIELGRLLKRRSFIVQSLSTSAFLLLLISPNMIFYVGFQLSYLAVLGIVLIFKPLSKIFFFRNRIADYFLQIIIVSLAAQIATAPLSVYYFNQFPSYFLLTNLLIIPISFLVISVGFIYVFFFWIPFMDFIIGKALGFLVEMMNSIVTTIHALPGSIVTNLHLNIPETLSLYAFIIFLIVFFLNRWKKALLVSLLCLGVFTSSKIIYKYRLWSTTELTIYAIPGHSAYLFRAADKSILMIDSSLNINRSKLNYAIEGDVNRLIKKPMIYDIDQDVDHSFFRKKGPFISFGGKLICLPNFKQQNQLLNVTSDIMIIRDMRYLHNTKTYPTNCQHLIFDASCKEKASLIYTQQFDTANLKLDYANDGTYVRIGFESQ